MALSCLCARLLASRLMLAYKPSIAWDGMPKTGHRGDLTAVGVEVPDDKRL
jgi:hypothetical protein